MLKICLDYFTFHNIIIEITGVIIILLLRLSILSGNVTSHNDPHVGNLFLRDGNSSLYDRFIFIDFDNAAFGYRAWDILYYLTKFPEVRRKSFVRNFEFN